MENKVDKLVPTSDLAEFYKEKLSIGLKTIYLYRSELENNKLLILKINFEIEEILKQIKYRLEVHGLDNLIEKFNILNKRLLQLKPFIHKYDIDNEGNRIKKVKLTKDYDMFNKLIIDKEEVIWACLDELGYTGKLNKETRRLR